MNDSLRYLTNRISLNTRIIWIFPLWNKKEETHWKMSNKGPWECTYNRQYVSARIQEMFGQNFSLLRLYMLKFFQCRTEDSPLHFYTLAKHNNVKTKQIYQQSLSKDQICTKHWHKQGTRHDTDPNTRHRNNLKI